jgi:hypothetical protein
LPFFSSIFHICLLKKGGTEKIQEREKKSEEKKITTAAE